MDYAKKKGLLRTLILSIVIKNKRIHGYGIYKEITDSSIDYSPSIGTIYRLLGELHREGLIDKEVVPGSKKKVYYLPTSKGLEEFINIATCFLNRTVRGLSILIPVLNKLYEEGKRATLFTLEGRIEELYNLSKDFLENIKILESKGVERIPMKFSGRKGSSSGKYTKSKV